MTIEPIFVTLLLCGGNRCIVRSAPLDVCQKLHLTTTRSELRKVLFLALSVTFFGLCMKYLWNH